MGSHFNVMERNKTNGKPIKFDGMQLNQWEAISM
jgi:hypothetical protein